MKFLINLFDFVFNTYVAAACKKAHPPITRVYPSLSGVSCEAVLYFRHSVIHAVLPAAHVHTHVEPLVQTAVQELVPVLSCTKYERY